MNPTGDEDKPGMEGLFSSGLTECAVQDYGLTGECCVAFYAVKAI